MSESFPMPENTGDCYAMLDYPVDGLTCLAFAYRDSDPDKPGRWKWFLDAEDGDQYECGSVQEFYDNCLCSKLVLVRRVYEGLGHAARERLSPEQYNGLYHSAAKEAS